MDAASERCPILMETLYTVHKSVKFSESGCYMYTSVIYYSRLY